MLLSKNSCSGSWACFVSQNKSSRRKKSHMLVPNGIWPLGFTHNPLQWMRPIRKQLEKVAFLQKRDNFIHMRQSFKLALLNNYYTIFEQAWLIGFHENSSPLSRLHKTKYFPQNTISKQICSIVSLDWVLLAARNKLLRRPVAWAEVPPPPPYVTFLSTLAGGGLLPVPIANPRPTRVPSQGQDPSGCRIWVFFF